jgi:sucrose-6-phosphate hydrolase SacC (GH32 family)
MSKFLLYYAGFDKDSMEEQIGVASSDNLQEWTYIGNSPQIPLRSQGTLDALQTSNPCVLKHDGIYKMWYQGKSLNGFLSVCYAESTDGISWKAHDKPILSSDSGLPAEFREGFQHPHVIFDEERKMFKMWCVIYKRGLTTIGFCESANGLVWTEMQPTSFVSTKPEHKYFYPFVMKENGGYRMWYTERFGKRWQISTAVSKDGIDWKAYRGNPVISPFSNFVFAFLLEAVAKTTAYCAEIPVYGIGSPFVWKDSEKYMLIAHSVGPRGKLYIPLYESIDGLEWKKVKNNILPKPTSAWNKFFQADPFLYVE